MQQRHAIVTGASIAGLSAAFWLRRTGWEVTVVERSEAFRDGGQNVDVRGVGHQVLDLMGLTEAVRAQHTTETGTVMVDSDGEVTAELPSDGPDGATAELEILRGDFARTILEHLPAGVEMVYGDAVATVRQDGGNVQVATESGRELVVDLLVVAEGVGSATRDLLFGEAVERIDLGIDMVFGTIPRRADDDDRWRWYNAIGGRQVHLRPDGHGTTRAILAHAGDDRLTGLDRESLHQRLRERFGDAGWQAGRVLDGFESSDDVYVDHLTRISVPTWSRGRVCLVGDAAWCVTPLGGGGASLALISGYVLAASLSTSVDGVEGGLAAYEEWMRPLVDDAQAPPPAIRHVAFPQSRLGLAVRRIADKALTSAPLKPLTARLTQVADTDRPLPPIDRVEPKNGPTPWSTPTRPAEQ